MATRKTARKQQLAQAKEQKFAAAPTLDTLQSLLVESNQKLKDAEALYTPLLLWQWAFVTMDTNL